MLEAIIASEGTRSAISKLSLRAAARRGWAMLSTGSSGNTKLAGSFSQTISGLALARAIASSTSGWTVLEGRLGI